MSSLSHFVKFAVDYGRRYLSVGGPTSRLEEHLTGIGDQLGFRTEVFATSTGLFVTGSDRQTEEALTLLTRVKDGSIRLNELQFLEGILRRIADRKLHLDDAIVELQKQPHAVPEYSVTTGLFAAFLVGVSASLSRYGSFRSALLSGLLTLLTYLLSIVLGTTWEMSGIFCDFFGCLFALITGGACALLLHRPVEEYAIGSFVLMVPGLTLTTAISELTEHDFLSGTSKLMKGLLTILAMGTAYVLFQEIAIHLFHNYEFGEQLIDASRNGFNFLGISCNLLLLLGFAIIFHVPRQALPWALISGATSWLILKQFSNPQLFVVAAFLASLSVGLLSLLFGRTFRLPSQVYSVPGILALVPGMLALSSFRSMVDGQDNNGLELGLRVALVGGAIVFGLFTARIPFVRVRRVLRG